MAAIKVLPNDKALRAHHALVREALDKYKAEQKKSFGSFFREGTYNDKVIPGVQKTLPHFRPDNVQVWLDIGIGEDGEEGYEKERVVIELFSHQVP